MGTARLYAGTALLIAANALNVTTDGGWGLIVPAVLGILLIVSSYAPEGGTR